MLVLVVMAVGGYYVWNNFNKQSESVLPSELNEDFDPTVNEPRFFALGLGSKQNSLSLEYTFPYSMEGKRIESVLICDKGLKLKERGQEEARDVEMNYALTKIVPENMDSARVFL